MIPKEINYDYILAVFRRRFWSIVILFFVIFVASIIYCITAPRLYRSTSLILVQLQEVPADYVKSTVTSDVKARLYSITEQVLSRFALGGIIAKFNLYPNLTASGRLDEAIKILRQTIAINVKDLGGERSPSSFEISFEGNQPHRVRDVTADLAGLYVEYNVRLRAEQAAGTLQFLNGELERMRETLRQKEELVRQFKEKHVGLLPEQMENNSRILTQLQQQMDSINRSLQSAEERAILLQTQSGRLRTLELGTSGSAGQGQIPNTLEGLRQELQRLQSRYSDKHPDVVRIKRLIAKAETGEQVGGGQAGLGEATDSSRTTDAQRLISVQTEDIATQKNVIAKEILALRQERQKIGLQIEDYHHRIESGPKTEQMFLDLRRDYQQASENYQTLLQKKLQAELAANLERTHKGGQFTILDPANLPRTAYKPDLKKILPMALMAALACGFGLGFLREYMDRAFWSRKELEGVLGIPVLATVPFIHTQRDLQKRKVRLAGTIFALCVMGSTLLIGLIILWHISFGPVPS